MKINVFVEGQEDQELVAELLVKLGTVRTWREAGKAFTGTTSAGNLINLNMTNGWSSLLNGSLLPELSQSPQEDVLNLVIFDADRPGPQQGGSTARRQQLLKVQAENGLFFELFLLPTDDADGQLEDLLRLLIPDAHQQVTDCFSHYENCVRQLRMTDGSAYNVPASKSRMFAYLEVLPLTAEEEKRLEKRRSTKFFNNPAYWNLDSSEIQHLREFLIQHVK
ncbi:MAG TPA: DUF3226 domain-containing protein [Hymenobacter sp.]|jgi:hypothetical protein|uniref:DUF3226 domain-containing protein n=1 Tax=Hymenobacter sp. TaxID=1898978 RepID=UPI002ED84D6F